MTDGWVYVGGTFDLFHLGHVYLLEAARKIGPVVVAVNTDDFAARYKRPPVMTTHERLRVLQACRHVDHAVVNVGREDSKVTIKKLQKDGVKVKYVVHGDDWYGESLMKQMGFTPGWLESNGIELRIVPYTKGISSSDIEDRVLRDRCHCGGKCGC